jgi:energy-coupling factor transporter ATP-binding protein EcfA2
VLHVTLQDDEPAAGPWHVLGLVELAEMMLDSVGPVVERPRIVAVDGRTASGKSTLARRLAGAAAGSATVHTDDIAWWHSAFDWAALMIDGVLEPARRGEAVSFRPPAWDARGRCGAIEVPAGTSLLIVEGVGAGRRETAHLVDAAVWVQSDASVRHRREAARIAAGQTDADVSERWMREEVAFIADQQPWERALIIVSGAPELPHDPETHAVVAPPPPST